MALEPLFLFLLNPAYCGSTVLAKVLLSSPKVGAVRPNAEGQWLPRLRAMMASEDRWSPEKLVAWDTVRIEWLNAFRNAYPSATVLFEKSPPNLMRAKQIEAAFPGAHFITWMRNPYAWSASLKKRRDHTADDSAFTRIAEDWVARAARQEENEQGLTSPLLRLSYEQFVGDVASTLKRIQEFVPAVGELDPNVIVQVKDYLPSRVVDFNQRQINSLSSEAMERLNAVFARHEDLLSHFGYKLFRA